MRELGTSQRMEDVEEDSLYNLPFFQDEFLLRATDPETWQRVVDLGKSGEAMTAAEEEEENEFISNLLALLANESIVPILARRYASRLASMQSDRGHAALSTLQTCLERLKLDREDFEDVPTSLDQLEELDAMRLDFIGQGKWHDVTLSFEHYLENKDEEQEAREETRRWEVCLQDLLFTPVLALLPLLWFVILVSLTRCDFPIPLLVFFALEALATLVAVEIKLGVVTTRVVFILSAILLACTSLLVTITRHGTLNRAACLALGLMQLAVCLVNCTHLRDFYNLSSSSEKSKPAAAVETRGQ